MIAMKSFILGLAFVPAILAQSLNETYLQGLLTALNASGLTELGTVAASIENTTVGMKLLEALPTGNFTIFAPSDAALQNISSNKTSNATLLATLLSYHVVQGNLTNLTSTYPNITIGRTLLNDSSYVDLEGNKSQVLAWSNEAGNLTVLNQPTNVTVTNMTIYHNLALFVIDAVLQPPEALPMVLDTQNLTLLTALLSNATLPSSNSSATNASNSTTINGNSSTSLLMDLSNTMGFTLFAPNDASLTNASSVLASLNMTTKKNLLENHVVNGSTVYSPSLSPQMNLTSASGEPLSFVKNVTGTFVLSGNSSAQIISSDVLAMNGVVHVIEGVLANTASNTTAASSAYSSASTAVASMASTTATGPVGIPTSSRSGNGTMAMSTAPMSTTSGNASTTSLSSAINSTSSTFATPTTMSSSSMVSSTTMSMTSSA